MLIGHFMLVRHDITCCRRAAVEDRFFTGEKIAHIYAEGSAKRCNDSCDTDCFFEGTDLQRFTVSVIFSR